MKPDLIAIANSSEARLFTRDTSGSSPLVTISHMEHLRSRLKAADLMSDHLGHGAFDNRRGGITFEPRLAAHAKEVVRFAHQVASGIEAAASREGCRHIYLVAGNPFLGVLRDALSEHCLALVKGTLDLDLTHCALTELEARLKAAFD